MIPAGTQYALFESVEAMPVEQHAPEPAGRRFSDFVVYVDESGDHSLASIDRDFPASVLVLADLVARPMGPSDIRPQQANQAFDILKKKFFCDGGRTKVGSGYENVGLMIYPPIKAKSPDDPTEAVAPTGNPQST